MATRSSRRLSSTPAGTPGGTPRASPERNEPAPKTPQPSAGKSKAAGKTPAAAQPEPTTPVAERRSTRERRTVLESPPVAVPAPTRPLRVKKATEVKENTKEEGKGSEGEDADVEVDDPMDVEVPAAAENEGKGKKPADGGADKGTKRGSGKNADAAEATKVEETKGGGSKTAGGKTPAKTPEKAGKGTEKAPAPKPKAKRSPTTDDYASAFAVFFKEHAKKSAPREPAIRSTIAGVMAEHDRVESLKAKPSAPAPTQAPGTRAAAANAAVAGFLSSLGKAGTHALTDLTRYLGGESDELTTVPGAKRRRRSSAVAEPGGTPVYVPAGVDMDVLKKALAAHAVPFVNDCGLAKTTTSPGEDAGKDVAAARALLATNARVICDLQVMQHRRAAGKPSDHELELARYLHDSLVATTLALPSAGTQ